MTTSPTVLDQAERIVSRLAAELTDVRTGECLCCYVWRQLGEFPCNGTHRHAVRYRDAVAPRATALEQRLEQVGACCCDCELFLNGFQAPEHEVDDCSGISEAEPHEPSRSCAGVRRGSIRPCSHWVRIRRW